MAESTDAPQTVREPTVGLVTVAFRSNDVLPTLLGSVGTVAGAAVPIVVVDNFPGEIDSAAQITHQHHGAYVAMPENPGYGAAINAGIRFLPKSVEWVVICNPDLEFSPGAIEELLAVAATDPSIGSVGPLIRNPDGSAYPSARRIPSLRTGIGHALFANVWPANPWTRSYRHDDDHGSGVRDAGWLSGACLLVRRSAFDAVGGFDDGYFMYFEDVDLGFRLKKAGWRNVYVPSAEAMHIGGHSTSGSSARMVRAHHDSAKRFLDRKYPGPALWPVRAVLNIGLSVRSRWLERSVMRSQTPHP
ncbi:glycosyltransferase family 2 protein [Microcella sp.]|uniref:glycosyltransferase family 2 protein n=1 Tax=Microcella sp. TaxID=1913979 RepID=UPI00391DF813